MKDKPKCKCGHCEHVRREKLECYCWHCQIGADRKEIIR